MCRIVALDRVWVMSLPGSKVDGLGVHLLVLLGLSLGSLQICLEAKP